jgi:hypothetical protein
MYLKTIKSAFVTGAMLATGVFTASLPALASDLAQQASGRAQQQIATFEAREPVTTELRELRGMMLELNRDADRLHMLTQTSRMWQTHASNLNQVKGNINRVGVQLAKLETMRGHAAPWQKELIDSVTPVAAEMANHTSAAIVHLNANKNYLWAPQYADHMKAIPELSAKAHGLVDNHLKAVDALDRIDLIQAALSEQEL